mgnify:CR=1 FL=1
MTDSVLLSIGLPSAEGVRRGMIRKCQATYPKPPEPVKRPKKGVFSRKYPQFNGYTKSEYDKAVANHWRKIRGNEYFAEAAAKYKAKKKLAAQNQNITENQI